MLSVCCGNSKISLIIDLVKVRPVFFYFLPLVGSSESKNKFYFRGEEKLFLLIHFDLYMNMDIKQNGKYLEKADAENRLN